MSLIKSTFSVDAEAVTKMGANVAKMADYPAQAAEVMRGIVQAQGRTQSSVAEDSGLPNSRIAALMRGEEPESLDELARVFAFVIENLDDDGGAKAWEKSSKKSNVTPINGDDD